MESGNCCNIRRYASSAWSGVGVVAVGLVHLAEVDVADAHLGLGGLGRVGEEGDEVLVLLLGLGEGSGSTLLEPAIGDAKLGAHHVLRVGVGVEQGLEVEAGNIVASALHGVHGLVVERLVGELGVLRLDGVDLLDLLVLFFGVLGQDDFLIFLLFANLGGLLVAEGDVGLRRGGGGCCDASVWVAASGVGATAWARAPMVAARSAATVSAAQHIWEEGTCLAAETLLLES